MSYKSLIKKLTEAPKVKKAEAKKSQAAHAETLDRYGKREKLGL
jgi:hypothetical protein